MLSNKLTFSLVFVVMLAFALTFVATPAMALAVTIDVPGPNDTITDAAGTFHVISEVISAAEDNGIETISPQVDVNIPFLDDFLEFGGSIEVLVLASKFTDIAATDDAAMVKTKAAAAIRRVIVSEIMWGQDISKVTLEQDDAQWIELFIESLAAGETDVLGAAGGLEADIKVRFTDNVKTNTLGTTEDLNVTSTPNDPTDDHIVVDVVSTVDRFGIPWSEIPGNSGNTEALTDGTPPTTLVSMYRDRGLETDAVKAATNIYAEKTMFGAGDAMASWKASAARINITGPFIATPGREHVASAGGLVTVFTKDPAALPVGSVIISEIRNDPSSANVDWVELQNTDADNAAVIKKHRLSIVVAGTEDADADGFMDHTQTSFTQIPDAAYATIPAGGYLLIVNRDPEDTPLADGINIADDPLKSDFFPKGANHQYFVDPLLDLPADGKFLLILRGDAKDNHETVKDIAGNALLSEEGTDVWPLKGWAAPTGDNFENGLIDDPIVSTNETWTRKASIAERLHKDSWEKVSSMGGLGYDPGADLGSSPGTPGYARDAVKGTLGDLTGESAIDDDPATEDPPIDDDTVIISEIMYDAGNPRRRLVQWIELYNTSEDQAANIGNWELEIRNLSATGVDSFVDSAFTFNANTIILPNQTLVLVSDRSSISTVPSNRVYNLLREHGNELGLRERGKVLLNSAGFYLKLTDNSDADPNIEDDDPGEVVDVATNLTLDGPRRMESWPLPAISEDGSRRSILRGPDSEDAGDLEDSWQVAKNTRTYYGHRDDIGSPGDRKGSPLPVSLSSFRPLRDKATGQVVITWITESELNNAGFNILRSDSEDAEFKVINLTGMIAGHGTTSEKHVYSYTDTTAKPNVAHYYQIEDVSLNGDRTTLRTTHLRGNVNASGKLTTTWSDLKLQK